jgi:uncharacterized cupin superfamily protein
MTASSMTAPRRATAPSKQQAIVILHRSSGEAQPYSSAVAALGSSDPFAAGREVLWSIPASAAGRVAFTDAIDVAAFPHTEAVIVLSGALKLSVQGSASVEVPAGQGAVISRGTRLRIEAAPGTRWAFHADTTGTDCLPGVTLLRADAALSPSAAPPAEFLIGPTPLCRSFNAFTAEASQLRAGTWDSTPYVRVSRPHKLTELMHILQGSVELTGEDGTVFTVGTGDTVLVPQDAPCAWDSRVHVAKFYVVQEAAR